MFAVKPNTRPSSRHQIATTAPRECAEGTACLNSEPAGNIIISTKKLHPWVTADYANRDAPQLQIAWKLKEQPLIWLCFLSFLQSVILLSPSFVPDGILACILNGRVSLSPVAPAALEEAFVSSSKSRPYKVSPGSGSSALTTARPLESLMPTAWQSFPPTGHYLVDDLHLIQYHAGTDLQRATRASRNRRNRPIEP